MVNDRDAHLTNFWRSVQKDPGIVSTIIRSTPPDECTLEAVNKLLRGAVPKLEESLRDTVDFFDPKLAAYWVWGMSLWIGDGFADPTKGKIRQMPSTPRGVHGVGIRENTRELLQALSDRLRNVTICTGDWERLVSDAYIGRAKTAVFLDPPYSVSPHLYNGSTDASVLERVESFCRRASSNIRIAVCGYADTMKLPPDWEEVAWTSPGGMNNNGTTNNRFKERIWFSPNCHRPTVGFDL